MNTHHDILEAARKGEVARLQTADTTAHARKPSCR